MYWFTISTVMAGDICFEQVVFHFDTRNISAVDEVSDVLFDLVDVFMIVAFFVHIFIPRK